MVSYGESSGTTMISSSPVSRAIGVASVTLTGDSLVSTAPTMTRPIIISSALSVSRLSWPSPTVPPAPVTLKTCTLRDIPACSWMTRCISRAVVSQPPPGLAGAMIRNRERSPRVDDRAGAPQARQHRRAQRPSQQRPPGNAHSRLLRADVVSSFGRYTDPGPGSTGPSPPPGGRRVPPPATSAPSAGRCPRPRGGCRRPRPRWRTRPARP